MSDPILVLLMLSALALAFSYLIEGYCTTFVIMVVVSYSTMLAAIAAGLIFLKLLVGP